MLNFRVRTQNFHLRTFFYKHLNLFLNYKIYNNFKKIYKIIIVFKFFNPKIESYKKVSHHENILNFSASEKKAVLDFLVCRVFNHVFARRIIPILIFKSFTTNETIEIRIFKTNITFNQYFWFLYRGYSKLPVFYLDALLHHLDFCFLKYNLKL